MRVASVQFQHIAGDKVRNLDTIGRYVESAAKDDCDLIVFPECCVSGYWHLRKLNETQIRGLAETVSEGATSAQIKEWAARFDITIGVGLVEIGGDQRLYNSYVVAQPDGTINTHRKLHCFISQYMKSGNEFTLFDLPGGWRAGILICYDNNIIENVRACALAGAEVILAPHQTGGCNSGSPYAMGVIDRDVWDHRETNAEAIQAEICGDKGRGWLMRWLPARAHDNGLFYIFSNGVGPDDDEVRTGNAMILDPYGRVIVETCRAGDDMIVADLDPRLLERCTGSRWIRARRPELYSSLCKSTGKEEDTRTVRFEHRDDS